MPLSPPFSGSPPAEVPLLRAPLVRVLSQIKFPQILNITKGDTVAPFQEIIRTNYPLSRTELIHSIQVQPNNQPVIDTSHIWRFEDKERHWRISLAPDFVALETTSYTSRTEFLSRMQAVIDALETTINPQLTQRIGLRYIDRLEGSALNAVDTLINPQFLGPTDAAYRSAALHILTQALFDTAEGAKLTARWGQLPAGVTVDPAAIEPINDPSWIMDFDMFLESQEGFNTQELSPLLASFAGRIYSLFRSMVTDQFLQFYGGQI